MSLYHIKMKLRVPRVSVNSAGVAGQGYLSTCGDTAAAFLLMVPCWLAEAEAGAAV